MFGNQKRIENKIKGLEQRLSEDIFDWEKNQIEQKLYKLKKKYKPNIFHDSSEKGTYKKPKEAQK